MHLVTPKVIRNITIQQSAYDFLFEFNRNYKAISYRFLFQILSLIFQKLKKSRDSDHALFRNNLSSEGWDLL